MENVTASTVKELQSKGEKLLVDITAKWCGPCKTLVPRLESMESSFPNVKFVKVDADENRDFLMSMGISSVPTVMIYDGENLINRSAGVQPESHYKSFLTSL